MAVLAIIISILSIGCSAASVHYSRRTRRAVEATIALRSVKVVGTPFTGESRLSHYDSDSWGDS